MSFQPTPDLSLADLRAPQSVSRWALLVDGENISHVYADQIMARIETLGGAAVRKVYCDPDLQSDWDADLRLSTVYLGSERVKNAADIRLVMDAMELALTGAVEGFIIVSKDGDFVPLVERLCEKGFPVLGVGLKRPSLALRHACTEYIELEGEAAAVNPNPPVEKPRARRCKPPSKIVPLVKKAVKRVEGKPEWYGSRQLASLIRAEDASFDAGAYGGTDLREVLEKTGQFEVREQMNGGWRTRFKT